MNISAPEGFGDLLNQLSEAGAANSRVCCDDPLSLMKAYKEQVLDIESFTEGQCFMLKSYSGICEVHDPKKPGIVVALLEPFRGKEFEEHRTNSLAAATFDCLIGLFDKSDGELCIRPASTHWLRAVSDQEMQNPQVEGYCLSLQESFAAYQDPIDYKPGDLITWSHPSLKHLKWPEKLAVCIEVTPGINQIPRRTEDKSSGAYHVAWDMVIGVVMDGEWELYYADSRRFKKWQPSS